MTPAAKLQNYLRERVEASGGSYRKAQWAGRKGCPDCFIWWTWPVAAFVEIKAGRDRLSVVQGFEIGRMRDAGIPVFTARTEADIDWIVAQQLAMQEQLAIPTQEG